MLLSKLKTNRKRIVIELWNHIVFLIQDAFILYGNKKYSSSCFMAFTAFEEIGKLNKFILGGESIDRLTRSHPEKHLFSITGHLSVSSHITRCFPREEKWFTSKFKRGRNDYNLMEFRNSLLYYDKNNIPSKKFKSKDAKSMIIIALEVLYQTEGFMDPEFTKKAIILRCQKAFQFSKGLFRTKRSPISFEVERRLFGK